MESIPSLSLNIPNTSKLRVVVVGGGPTGVEHAGAIAERNLEKMGVNIRLQAMVENYDGKTLCLKNQPAINTYTVIWSAGVTGETFPGLPKSSVEKGRILTDPNCRVLDTHDIFAIDDISLMKLSDFPKGHPGLAQVAIQMGKYLGKHLPGFYKGETAPPFKYFDKGNRLIIRPYIRKDDPITKGVALKNVPEEAHLVH
jgi:NADH dehydrogenase FAD-containing subunit